MKKLVLFIVFFLVACGSKSSRVLENPNLKHNPQFEAFGKKFVIATQGPASTQAAKKMFDLGGNIFDAAVAASFAISVERPQSTGIGGGGFMMIYNAKEKKTYAIDFREKAPMKASADMFVDAQGKIIPDKSITGIHAFAVPGTVAGLVEIQKKFGKLSLRQTVQPSIEMAENGIPVYKHLANAIADEKNNLQKSSAAKKIFFHSDGTPLAVGETLIQKDLARTLKDIVARGADGFYRGRIAKALIAESNKHKGLLTQKDLNAYTVKYREPVVGKFKNFTIVSMPPPSSGGTHVIQILKILDGFDLKSQGQYDPKTIHQVASAMELAYADRSNYLGDSDFADIPVQALISNQHIQHLRAKISDKAIAAASLSPPSLKNEPTQTTHFSMMDDEGNVVSSTQTVNGYFGSKIVAEGTGIVLNNEMDDFTSKVGEPNMFGVIGGVPNAIAPEKRPLSSMSPTILFNPEGKAVLALGTPAGSKIITCVVQTILNYTEFGLPLYESVQSMRYHDQWYPEEIQVEAPGFVKGTQSTLEKIGHKISVKENRCSVQAVANEFNGLHGVSDIRGEGMALAN